MKQKGNYIFDENGRPIAWRRVQDNEELEYKIQQLQKEVDDLKNEQRQKEYNAFAADKAADFEVKVNTAHIQRAADQIQDAIEKAFSKK